MFAWDKWKAVSGGVGRWMCHDSRDKAELTALRGEWLHHSIRRKPTASRIF
jgi:hypothetical protein